MGGNETLTSEGPLREGGGFNTLPGPPPFNVCVRCVGMQFFILRMLHEPLRCFTILIIEVKWNVSFSVTITKHLGAP